MADEMDESRDAEKISEGVKGSSAGRKDETQAVEAAATKAESGQSLETEGLAGSDSEAADDAAIRGNTATAAAQTTETVYDAVSSSDQPGPQSRQATSAGAATRYEGPARDTDELDLPGLDLLYDVELDATLQFGSKEMLLRDVLELGPGDVVELDRHIAQPVDLVVGDRIVARGEVVVASGNFALRITEVAAPQMRLESIRCLF